MRVRFPDAGVDERGPAVDLRGTAVAAGEVLAAIRDPRGERVQCGAPAPVHERVGFLHRSVSVAPVAAVAAAARTWGEATEHDADVARAEAELDALSVPNVDLAAARERVAETAADVDRLRERVARTSGRVEARRDLDADPGTERASLADATRELSEAETAHHAAREALDAARERARDARDARQQRLELEDRRDNARRAARRVLAERYAPAFERAVRALPVPGTPAGPGDFEGPDWACACAALRIARPGAPVVVSGDVFERAARARAALAAPVVLVEV